MPVESAANSNVIWIVLGGVIGALAAGICIVFVLKRSRKDQGRDDDVISNYGGGNLSSPQIGDYKSNLSTSYLLRTVPAVVSPSAIADQSPPLVVGGQVNMPDEEEQYYSDLDIPRPSTPAEDMVVRRPYGSPNLWQSAMTSSPRAFQSSVFPSNLSDSYSIRPSGSSDGTPSESFSIDRLTPSRDPHSL
ncbi:hypothetical protein DYB37_006891 [Aphanomyces astaci]|uniref:Uncharacterized protein n=1 Tax=Aphanomyces astaci TaxID=112090 RepID=A0A3R6ZI62_APHAT|nr:hypothetical protein DYB35_008816 [Aphanomyces astaci]RHZ09313.1 hypothetical protein DYB37_006891 [Aphanomyces astaci]